MIMLELRPMFRGKYSTVNLCTQSTPIYSMCDDLLCQKKLETNLVKSVKFNNNVRGAEFLEEPNFSEELW